MTFLYHYDILDHYSLGFGVLFYKFYVHTYTRCTITCSINLHTYVHTKQKNNIMCELFRNQLVLSRKTKIQMKFH